MGNVLSGGGWPPTGRAASAARGPSGGDRAPWGRPTGGQEPGYSSSCHFAVCLGAGTFWGGRWEQAEGWDGLLALG